MEAAVVAAYPDRNLSHAPPALITNVHNPDAKQRLDAIEADLDKEQELHFTVVQSEALGAHLTAHGGNGG